MYRAYVRTCADDGHCPHYALHGVMNVYPPIYIHLNASNAHAWDNICLMNERFNASISNNQCAIRCKLDYILKETTEPLRTGSLFAFHLINILYPGIFRLIVFICSFKFHLFRIDH